VEQELLDLWGKFCATPRRASARLPGAYAVWIRNRSNKQTINQSIIYLS